MGAWGAGGFDNDGALTWFDDLDAIGTRAITSALRVRGSPIDIDDAQMAIAAARGHGVKRLPGSVVAWLARTPKISSRGHARAVKAVAEVRDRSELTELWDGDKSWARAIASLLVRLAAKPKAVKVPKRTQAPPPQIHERSVRSPDQELVASASSVGDEQTCTVMISGAIGGGSVCFADCRYDAVALTWRGNAVLEIGAPKGIAIDRQDDRWQLYDRVVRCRYVSTRTRATTPKRSAGRRPPGRARS
jgi:hypothetical protein